VEAISPIAAPEVEEAADPMAIQVAIGTKPATSGKKEKKKKKNMLKGQVAKGAKPGHLDKEDDHFL
jgi:hypothetical protein